MEYFYFAVVRRIGKFVDERSRTMSIILMLLYFPILCVISFFVIYPSSKWLAYFFLIFFALFFPLLYYPAKYALSGKEFPRHHGTEETEKEKELNSFDISNLEYEVSKHNFVLAEPSSESNQTNSGVGQIDFSVDIDYNGSKVSGKQVSKGSFDKRRVIFNKTVGNKLSAFFNEEASKYYDVLEFDLNRLFELIYLQEVPKLEDKILLHDHLSSKDVKEMLFQLKDITKTPMKDLSELFVKMNHKSNKIEPLNWNSVKSSVSQNFKI